jgi:DNA-binding NtrC family response regulator
MDRQLSVMVVDDEQAMLEWLSILLEQHGYRVRCFSNGEKALQSATEEMPDIVVVDIKMPGIGGLEVLSRLRVMEPDIIGIVMTAFSSVDSAIDAIRKGASDYLIKPFEVDQLLVAIEKAMSHQSLRRENRDLKRKVISRFSMEGIIGKSRPIMELLEKVRLVADKDSTVLISGESGTGKELIAKAIHYSSARAERPFFAINCGSFTHSLLESELFGHVKGSFTGAHKDKEGLLVAARGGTFFLDEVSELDRELQVKLLRALQERQVLPVGGTRYISFDVRLVAATNRNLKELVENGSFRDDLFYRLNVIPMHVPSLRDRASDIPLLVERFLEVYSRESGDKAKVFSRAAMEKLMRYHWPGNVRELENVVERLCVMIRGSEIEEDDLAGVLRSVGIRTPFAEDSESGDQTMAAGGLGGPLSPTLKEIEKAYTFFVLEHRAGGQKRLAAKLLGINESTLHRRLERYAANLDAEEDEE